MIGAAEPAPHEGAERSHKQLYVPIARRPCERARLLQSSSCPPSIRACGTARGTAQSRPRGPGSQAKRGLRSPWAGVVCWPNRTLFSICRSSRNQIANIECGFCGRKITLTLHSHGPTGSTPLCGRFVGAVGCTKAAWCTFGRDKSKLSAVLGSLAVNGFLDLISPGLRLSCTPLFLTSTLIHCLGKGNDVKELV